MRNHVLAALVIFVGLTACGKDDGGQHPAAPTIRTDRDSLGFGQEYNSGTYVGTSAQESLLVENLGTQDLVISSVDKTGDAAFSMTLPQNLTVKGLDHTFIALYFAPTEAKTYTGAIVIHSNDANNAQKTVQLTGRGIPPPEKDGGP